MSLVDELTILIGQLKAVEVDKKVDMSREILKAELCRDMAFAFPRRQGGVTFVSFEGVASGDMECFCWDKVDPLQRNRMTERPTESNVYRPKVNDAVKAFDGQVGERGKPLCLIWYIKFMAWVPVVQVERDCITWDDNQTDRCVPPNPVFECSGPDDFDWSLGWFVPAATLYTSEQMEAAFMEGYEYGQGMGEEEWTFPGNTEAWSRSYTRKMIVEDESK